MVNVTRDLTEQRRMERVALESQKLADLGTLAAGIAHEINSPLQIINGLSERMIQRTKDGNLDMERLGRELENINRNGWRVANIVRSLLTYARASKGEFQQYSLNSLVVDTLLLIEHQLKNWSNVSVQTELEPDLPLMLCDGNKISQLIINLVTNARDAMPQGGKITIRTAREWEQERLILQVTDSGDGIPPEIRGKIFDPFFTTKGLGSGTGLGLSIVLGIVRSHGGEIEVDSSPGQGTTFTVYFPENPPQGPEQADTDIGGRYEG